MNNHRSRSLLLSLLLPLFVTSRISLAQPSLPQEQPPDDVRGDWTIYSKNIDDGQTVEKHVQIHQNGNRLSRHFEGRNQSRGIQGTVTGRHIEFSTKTGNALTFRGQIEGNKMSGLYGLHGRHAEWRAVRTN